MAWKTDDKLGGGQDRILDNRPGGGKGGDADDVGNLTDQIPDTEDALLSIDAALARSHGRKQYWGNINETTVIRGPCQC